MSIKAEDLKITGDMVYDWLVYKEQCRLEEKPNEKQSEEHGDATSVQDANVEGEDTL